MNAVRLGSWVTFKLCSNINLSMRDLDFSYPDEALLTGNQRTFYPLSEISTEGNYKIPESGIINNGISNTTSYRYNFSQSDIPYFKNNFQTRIAFSDIAVNDAFKNGYRVFQASHYKDYPSTYGGLMKLVEVGDDLLAVFEHAVALIPVNERVVAGSANGENVYINSRQVLPETMVVLSSDYGTQWPDSVIKTTPPPIFADKTLYSTPSIKTFFSEENLSISSVKGLTLSSPLMPCGLAISPILKRVSIIIFSLNA
jgi:hypothetical protein